MKFKISILAVLFITFLLCSKISYATYDPLSVPNNKIGIHLLFPEELSKARELVNSNGGEWGYVTIPIQAIDKDLVKWQKFMDECKKLKIIPLIRISTEGDYFNQGTWRKPENSDVVDFANFLNSLSWPTKNRYVIIFNEVNRADEWGGEADPEKYAEILSHSVTIFKSKNQDFFIISSGMDNAAATGNGTFNQYDYFEIMNSKIPGIFNQIDGYSSHSYPNPAFSQPPDIQTKMSISSFRFERDFIKELGSKDLPIFITETGWDQTKFTEEEVVEFYKKALSETWNDPKIVAITPFLLNSGPGPFEKFSFLRNNGDKKQKYTFFESLSKTKGKPVINKNKSVLGSEENDKNLQTKDFSDQKKDNRGRALKTIFWWMAFKL